MITIETIRSLEADAAMFSDRLQFSRHVGAVVDVVYDGVQLTEAGGLIRSDAADAIDRRLARLFREAGYSASDSYELACAIWAAK